MEDYITIYGEGLVNINTAGQVILIALGLSESSVQDIITYRDGPDGKPATQDDHPIRKVEDLKSGSTYNAIFKGRTLSMEDTNALNKAWITVSSSFYRADSYAEVNNVKKHIVSVAEIKSGQTPKQLYWYEE